VVLLISVCPVYANAVTRLALRTLAVIILLPAFLVVGDHWKYSFARETPPASSPIASMRAGQASGPTQDWEPVIRKFEDEDKVNPPKPGTIVFTGSSSIARWDSLVSEMNGLRVINRGFGGSQYSDLNQYAKRLVVAYHPPAVVVYEGDNDLAAESTKTPESVAADARSFVQIVHSALPETWIYLISIKPSKARLAQWPKMKAANSRIRDFAKTQKRVEYIDVASAMFDAQGKLPDDFFVEDGLHPTPKCYALWTSIIKPVLLKRFGSAN
jgi:lysophospholipase L1-like esterase